MTDDLEARLKASQRSLEGLMSLIPAEKYYGKDESITSTQHEKVKRKQTKAEKRAAKRAKLDTASHKTAKDVMDENARKRKRDSGGGSAESSDIDMDVEKEKPMEGLKLPSSKSKKRKVEHEPNADVEAGQNTTATDEKEAKAKAQADKRRQKAEKKKVGKAEKAARAQQKREGKKALQQEFSTSLEDAEKVEEEEEIDDDEENEQHDIPELEQEHLDDLDISGLIDEPVSTATPSADSNASTASVASAASSSSSVLPPTTSDTPETKTEKPFKLDPVKHEALQARLLARLEALRTARKADGLDGRPAKNRAELIEARRKKEAERKAARKAQWKLAKEDEERVKAEEQLARIRGGSGSPSVLGIRSSPENEQSFAFGRVAWKDGQQLDRNASGLLNSQKKKGRSDPRTALEAAEKKRARINALDETKRKDIQEKDLWLSANKRAQGEKVHDDAGLLKKSLKRQEKEKAKSKKEWKDRIFNVQKGKEVKQKKREQNLQKRKDDKGSKGKKKVKKPGKKVRRPGFEGTFKAR
ncbi:SURF6-domain-containing protein [Lophiostoma macrostomum CBS 122681]|uniref:SURF6-domain-containing protein n=1 Tax=Lophiostoma macrostomum CBS 122681 TaxID=1314788 RepID=A0A6A6TNT3_9PLEO|nr:SURF6-domain-containing protein [Lophiostoma macrostomum CBS 122681]